MKRFRREEMLSEEGCQKEIGGGIPTDLFTILEPENPSHDVLELQ